MNQLDNIVMYAPSLQIWSGTVKVRRHQDLGDVANQLPPSDLVSDGRKRIVPRDALNPLLAIRKGVDRILRNAGYPLMGNIAIPASKAHAIEAELKELEESFNQAREDLCSNLDDWYARQAEAHPGWGEMLAQSRLDADVVRARCRFTVAAYKVTAPAESPERFEEAAMEAYPALITDVAASAKVLSESVLARDRISQKQVNCVRRLIEKLDSFGFIDSRVGPVADALKLQMELLPKTGVLSVVEATLLSTMVRTLADPELILEEGVAAIHQAVRDDVNALPTINMVFPPAPDTQMSEEENDEVDGEPVPALAIEPEPEHVPTIIPETRSFPSINVAVGF